MAIEKIIDIKIDSNADQAVGSLKAQLREAQAEVAALSDKFGVTSVEATNAAKKAAELKDKIGDAKALTDAFNPDAKFKALSSSLAGVAGGFAAAQGGMALFGVQSEDVEKTLLKVQSAMALSQGLQAIGESIDSFKQLGAVIENSTKFQKLNSIAVAGAAIVQKLFTGAVDTTATSFKLLKGALISTGIGALVVGLGYLVSKMNESSDAAEQLTLKQEGLNKQLEITKKLTEDAAKAIDYNTQIQLANAKKRGASEKELLRIQLDAYEAKGKANNKEIEDIQKTQKNSYDLTKEQNKRIEDLRQQNIDLQRQGNVAIANLDADLAVKQKTTSTKSGEDAKTKRKELADEKLRIANEEFDNLFAAEQQYQSNQLEAINIVEASKKAIEDAKLSEKDLAIQNEDKEYQNKLFKAQQFGLDTQAIEEEHLSIITAIRDKYKIQEDEKKVAELDKKINDDTTAYDEKIAAIDAEQALFQSQLDNKLITEEQYNDKTKKLSDTRVQVDKKEREAKAANMQAVANLLGNVASLLGESTAAGKAAAVAQATISTYQAAVSSYNSLSGIPIVGPALGAVAAGVAVASGIANVNKILSVQTPGGGGGGGSAPTPAATPQPPSFNVVGSSSTNQLAQTIGQQSQTPVRSYVVASDVSTAQALDRNIISNATIGG
jgi:hypothetical protein